MSPEQLSAKVCVVCGVDCSTRPRAKDRRGRYYCRPCYDHALRASRDKTARPAAPARAVSRAALPTAAPPACTDPLFDLVTLESSGAVVKAAPRPCPRCGATLAPQAVLCTACGHDLRTGRQVAAAIPVSAPAGAGTAGSRLGSLRAWLVNPWIVALAQAAAFLALFAAARSNESLALAYLVVAGLYGLAAAIWTLVAAFSDGALSGLLCLLLPFYAFYFVLAKSGNPYLVGSFVISVLAQVLGYYLPLAHA